MTDQNSKSENKNFKGTYALSEIIGNGVFLSGKKIGKLADLIIVESGKLPEVTHLYVTRSFGDPSLIVPWDKVVSLKDREAAVDIEKIEKYEGVPADNAVLLKDHILDKKVLDMEDHEVEMVYDINLILKGGKLYVSGVDFGGYGLLRRLHLRFLGNFFAGIADKFKDKTISWAYVQPLPTNISSFGGDVKLKVLKDKLSNLEPVDLADVLEEMDNEHRVLLMNELDAGIASDTLEEINPNVQREIVYSLKKEKVAKLINEMTPGQAADVLSVLPWADAKVILKLLAPENAKKIKSILEKQDEKVVNFATNKIIRVPSNKTIFQARREFQKLAQGKDIVMYLYIVDDDDKLLGVLDIKELLKANESALLSEVMTANMEHVLTSNTLKDASEIFKRYGFRAIPVLDENNKLMGAISYRDVMLLGHRFL
ncbi:MgtE intracellular N domain protein [Candidatus Gugararchaeum adminiculabundum]|nr:MgtE intracellular N domain protein [Candidatus Gugararchaeum adminiculabundum]